MALVLKLLEQVRPSTTGTTQITGPAALKRWIIKNVVVCNVSGGGTPKFSIYHDPSGTATFDESTALYFSSEIDRDTTVTAESLLVVTDGEDVAVQTNVADDVTFTFYGAEEDV